MGLGGGGFGADVVGGSGSDEIGAGDAIASTDVGASGVLRHWG